VVKKQRRRCIIYVCDCYNVASALHRLGNACPTTTDLINAQRQHSTLETTIGVTSDTFGNSTKPTRTTENGQEGA
jgi:hypothetical protein